MPSPAKSCPNCFKQLRPKTGYSASRGCHAAVWKQGQALFPPCLPKRRVGATPRSVQTAGNILKRIIPAAVLLLLLQGLKMLGPSDVAKISVRSELRPFIPSRFRAELRSAFSSLSTATVKSGHSKAASSRAGARRSVRGTGRYPWYSCVCDAGTFAC
jgi:hypothetical protein